MRMPLAADVNLAALAGALVGYVGADIASLTREAAMIALRTFAAAATATSAAAYAPLMPVAMGDMPMPAASVQSSPVSAPAN